jgi:hypothetical protein
MRILIVPSSLRAGAKRCMTVAREANAAALRVGSLPSPEGLPPEAAGQLRSAMAQLQRSCLSAEREAQFLNARAQRGLMADGPFGSLIDLTGPGLLSPWAMPAGPKRKKEKKHHWWDGPKNFGLGMVDEVADTAKGLSDAAAGIAGHAIDGDINPVAALAHALGLPRLSDHIPYIGKRRKELDQAADWAVRHPDEFALAVGKDVIAYDDHAKHHHAHGAGRNTVGILGLLVPFSKAGAAAKATKAVKPVRTAARDAAEASGASRTVQQGAHANHVVSAVPRAGESAAAHAARRAAALNELKRTQRVAEQSEQRLNRKVQEAREAAESAAEKRREAVHEAGQAASEAGAKVLGSHDEAQK